MMRKLNLFLIFLSLPFFLQAQSKGNLFIIGGGNRSDELMKQMLNTAGFNAKDYIVVLPMASEIPDVGFKIFATQIQKLDNRLNVLITAAPALVPAMVEPFL